MEHESISAASRARAVRRETFVALLALAALGLVCILAFFAKFPNTPPENAALSDQVALVFLAACAAILWWPRALHYLEAQPGAATFFLTAAMFVTYGLARRVAPENGWSLRFVSIPDDEYVLPYSAYVVALSTLLCAPLWWRKGGWWTRALLSGFGIIALLALFSFWLLARFYPVGAAERLDPSVLPNLFLLLVEYGCVALLCRAVCLDAMTRRATLRVLPLVLAALWARFHFFPASNEEAP